MNVVMTGAGELVEVQATGEGVSFPREPLDRLLDLRARGIGSLRRAQDEARPAPRAARVARGRVATTLEAPCDSCSRHATHTSCASSARCSRRTDLEPLPDGVELPPETGATFAENALIKATRRRRARPAARRSRTTPASWSTALGGAPGIHSARYAGEHATDEQNLAKLLDELRRPRRPPRGLRVRARARRAGRARGASFEGRCEGIADRRAARQQRGFGYDPVFVPDERAPGDERTMAELSPAEKDAISHRGRAARALARLAAGAGMSSPPRTPARRETASGRPALIAPAAVEGTPSSAPRGCRSSPTRS